MATLDYQRVLENFADAVVAARRDGTIVYANRAAEALFACDASCLLGKPLWVLVPERIRSALRAGFTAYVEERHPPRPVRMHALRQDDGREVEVELNLSSAPGEDGELFVAALRDLTHALEVERRAHLATLLRAVTAAAARLTAKLEASAIADTAVDTLVEEFGVTLARVWVSATSQSLRLKAQRGETRLLEEPRKSAFIADGDTQLAEAALQRQRVVRAAPRGPQYVGCFPMVVASGLEGVLEVWFDEEPAAELLDLVETLGSLVGSALHDAALLVREHEARERAFEFARLQASINEALRTRTEELDGARLRLAATSTALTAVATSTRLEEAAEVVLASLGASLGWDGGVFWQVQAGRLAQRARWIGDPQLTSFFELTSEVTLGPGEGVPGKALAERAPVVVTDATTNAQVLPIRQGAAKDVRLRSAGSYPVLVHGEVAYVLEFFAHTPAPPRPEVDDTLRSIAATLGQQAERQLAEQDLGASRERLAVTLAGIGDAVMAADAGGGLAYLNPAAEALLGTSSEEAKGKPLTERLQLLDPVDRAPVPELVARLTAQQGRARPTASVLLVRPDGDERSVEIGGARLPGGGCVLVLRDTTERRREEERHDFVANATILLSRSHDLGAVLESVAKLAVPVVADWCVVETEGPGGEKLEATAHAEPAKVELARRLRALYPPKRDESDASARVKRTGRAELFRDIPDELLAATAVDEHHLRMLREVGMKSAMVVPIVGRDRNLGTIGFVNSESGRRFGEADLRMAEEMGRGAGLAIENARLVADLTQEMARREEAFALLDTLFSTAPVGLAFMDRELRYVRANEELAAMIGRPARELIGRPLEEVAPEAAAAVGDLMREVMRTGTPQTGVELGPMSAEGGDDHFLFSAYPVRVGEETLGAGIVLVDISERRRAEVERERLYEEAQAAVRARDEFLSIASHELRTPLTSLQLQLQSLMRVEKRAGHETARLEVAERQVRRLAKLIGQLLDVSRITSGRLQLEAEPIDLVELVRETLTRFADEAAASGCTLAYDGPDTLVGDWDRMRLEQVLTNLVGNAIKYGKGKPVAVSVAEAHGAARLEVRDQGIGVAREDLDRIFGRFERAVSSRHFGGLGLGLFITRQIVHAMGGRVAVESELGRGSRFTVDLPLERQGVVHASQPS